MSVAFQKPLTFSAPGRTELSGNHTDHQHGHVLGGAINRKIRAEVTNISEASSEIRIFSEGYAPVTIALSDLMMREEEKNTTAALARGMAASFSEKGAVIPGFDAHITSEVAAGSGLSSSAAFEVLLGRIFNDLCFLGALSPVEIAKTGQWAENHYFGKPCGLMDQMVSSVGGLVFLDFEDPVKPIVEKINFDFEQEGYAVVLINCGASHADLTDAYASIPQEMKDVASYFKKETLRDVRPSAFYEAIPVLRQKVGDRAVLRSLHFFEEEKRVQEQANALRCSDVERFLQLVKEGCTSQISLLQNITPFDNPTSNTIQNQEMAMALAFANQILQGQGAVRAHGGGFAGTIQAFVPLESIEVFCDAMNRYLEQDACDVVKIC